jgi:aminopeptidase N
MLLFCGAVAAAQNPAVDVLHYRIDVGVPAEGEEIAARVELTVKPVAKPLATLDLDFTGYTIDEVTVDGAPAAFTHERDQLRIATGGKSETFRASVRYHGKPSDGLIIRANKYGRRGVFADNWPNRAHLWFPSVDHPSDKATVELIVSAPPEYEVIANGLRVGTTTLPNGQKQTHWSESTPIPVHCMVFGAGGLSVVGVGSVDDTEITYYLDPEDRDIGVRQLGRTRQMVRIFSTMFGPFPYEKLALVESSTRYGGMENATAIFLDEKKLGSNVSLEPLVAHEIAHQWFGDAVTQKVWSDVWLSEGFATYFEAVFFERADGREAFLTHMRGERDIYLKANREKSRPVYDRPAELMQLLSAFTYEKGAWVLHMLRGIMGDGPFFAAVHEYYMRHRNGNASTADLQAIMERHAGQPLGWFFKQWIFEAGHPLYAFAWKWDAGKVAVTIEQKQTGALFRMPVVVEVRGNDRVQRETVLVDERREEIEFASEEAPTSVVMDPDEVILKEMVTAEER